MMRLNPPILEDRPQLRERVFGLVAISTVLLGGAMAMNSIITGGWQWGAASASEHTQYYDDVDQQWSEPAPGVAVSQPIALANASVTSARAVATMTPQQAAASATGLDGSSVAVSLTSYAPQAAAPLPTAQAQSSADDASSKSRFDAIEADIRQALPQEQAAQSDDQSGASPN